MLKPAVQWSFERIASLPLSAWDDVAGTKLDPADVIKARKREIVYAERKRVAAKIPRRVAKSKGER